jgi:hypothetical protein
MLSSMSRHLAIALAAMLAAASSYAAPPIAGAELPAALPPPPSLAPLVAEATPFVAPAGEILGVAWLEGVARNRYAVRFAPWSGEGWGKPEMVAPPGPGSQLALAGARLADGRLLLAWAAFDGNDDEIVAALRAPGGGWSAPAPVAADNGTPDITPAVTADAEGALVAWSRFADGEYRVAVARFDGERFREARFAGPAGTLYPTFESAPAGAARLLYRTARPRGWALAELDRSGAVRRTVAVESAETERPRVAIESGRVVLAWGAGAQLRRTERAWN